LGKILSILNNTTSFKQLHRGVWLFVQNSRFSPNFHNSFSLQKIMEKVFWNYPWFYHASSQFVLFFSLGFSQCFDKLFGPSQNRRSFCPVSQKRVQNNSSVSCFTLYFLFFLNEIISCTFWNKKSNSILKYNCDLRYHSQYSRIYIKLL
jgi:hypothetical protein